MKKKIIITPRGPSIWPYLNTPDTKYDPDGKYRVKLALNGSEDDVQQFVAEMEALRDEFFDEQVAELMAAKKAGLAKQLTKADVVTVELDGETGDETGRLLFTASMKAGGISKKTGKPWSQKPDLFNAKGAPLKNPPLISSGSEMKLSVEVEAYLNNTSKQVGVSYRLKAAQILTLSSGGNRTFGGYGFASEDGDEIGDREVEDRDYDQPEDGPPFDTDSSDHDDL